MSDFDPEAQFAHWVAWLRERVVDAECHCDFEECPYGHRAYRHFNVETWAAWIIEHGREPPKAWQCCDCRTYRELCTWKPTPQENGLCSLSDGMKHYHPPFAIEASMERKHPLFDLLERYGSDDFLPVTYGG